MDSWQDINIVIKLRECEERTLHTYVSYQLQRRSKTSNARATRRRLVLVAPNTESNVTNNYTASSSASGIEGMHEGLRCLAPPWRCLTGNVGGFLGYQFFKAFYGHFNLTFALFVDGCIVLATVLLH